MVSSLVGPRAEPGPTTRPLAPWSFVLPLLVATVLGLGLAIDLRLTALAVATVLVGGVMLARLDWAVLVVVGSAVFEDYLAFLDPRLTKALAVVLLGSWAVRRGWHRLHHGRTSAVMMVAAAFLVVLLTSTLIHNNGMVGLSVLLRYVGFLAVLAVLVDTMRGGLAPARVARVYVASCAAAAVCGIVTYVGGFGLEGRVSGPIADPNDFGFHLAAGVPLALALRSDARRPWHYDLAAALMTLAVLGTFSRGALLGMACMVVVAAVTRVLALRVIAAGLVVAATLAAVAIGSVPELVRGSVVDKGAVAEQNVAERLDLWRAASEMTVENPVLGLGPGSFALYHGDYRDRLPEDVTHRLDVAHNTYLEVSAELGLVGLAVWLALLVVAGYGAWRCWSRDRNRLAGGVLVSLAGSAVAAAFVTEQYFLPLWLLMALSAALGHTAPSTTSLLSTQGTRDHAASTGRR